jgi:hypothetical protein
MRPAKASKTAVWRSLGHRRWPPGFYMHRSFFAASARWVLTYQRLSASMSSGNGETGTHSTYVDNPCHG